MSYTARAIVYKFLYTVLRIYWFVFRPQLYGVKCLIQYRDKLLLIRNTYGDMKWTFPGGGIKRDESPELAVQREVKEEVGITLTELHGLGEYTSTEGYKRDTVKCYFSEVHSPELKIDRNEIYEAGWFQYERLPEPQSSDASRVMQLYLSTHWGRPPSRPGYRQ